VEMDNIDLGILDALKEDARTSFREIAKRLEVSPDTVGNRFDRLQKEGVIIGSTVVVDPSKIGYTFIARFGINVRPAYSSQVLEQLIRFPSVIIASKLVGGHDLMAISVVKDMPHLWKLRDTILEMPYVEKMEVGIWIETMRLLPHFFII
jgi:DNA-binding Lrp family transcriptional regulator